MRRRKRRRKGWKGFKRVKEVLKRREVRKKYRRMHRGVKPIKYMSKTANRGFSMIKYKIDRVKNPKIYVHDFPELELLKEAAKIDLTS